MKLLHIASSYPLQPSDSSAPFMEEMLSSLADRGHSVTVVVPRVQSLVEGPRRGVQVVGAPYAPRPLQVWGRGRSLTESGGLRPSAIAVTPLAMTALALKLRALVRAEQPDAVHLHWVLPQGVLAEIVPRSVPVVISLHGADAKFATSKLRLLAKRALKRADAVVAASSGIAAVVATIYPELPIKLDIVPHGANDELFRNRSRAESRKRLSLDPDSRVALAVGRLVPKKGFDVLLESVPLLAENIQVVIVGEGPDRSRLEALVEPEFAHRVHLIGSVDRETVADWYSASDVVVVPSSPVDGDVDSGPVVVVEALAASRPVVSTPVGMSPDLVKTGHNGVLVETLNPGTLAAAMGQAIANSPGYGREARATFEHLGGWDRTAVDLEGVYAKAVMRRRATLAHGTAP